jgi:hypothetical protein
VMRVLLAAGLRATRDAAAEVRRTAVRNMMKSGGGANAGDEEIRY